MKRLKVLIALAMGIMASASGVLQIQAAGYLFYADFDTKQVTDFNDFNPSFQSSTVGLNNTLSITFNTFYKMNNCSSGVSSNANIQVFNQINATGSNPRIILEGFTLPCRTNDTFIQRKFVRTLTPEVLATLISDDMNFVRFNAGFYVDFNASAPGRQISLFLPEFLFDVSYDFNTTYLFNYFLSDSNYVNRNLTNATLVNAELNFIYVMTTAGNDTYTILNSNTTTYPLNSRRKFAVDYEGEFFRGDSVGSRYILQANSGTMNLSSSNSAIQNVYDYHFLNTASNSQAIVDAPIFEFEEEDCGSFLALNVGCFINNAFAYITNDAPIVSDAFTLLNAGIEMAAQTFGIIGEFADDNVFGVLILAGFGFIAVKWFLKND
jgi:hypothetical protein